MNKIIISILLSFCSFTSFSQLLTATIILEQEPYCRTAGYQSGNGVLIASSSGGTGSIHYQWYDSTFTALSNQTVPAGLIMSPGKYYLEVTDEFGEMALDSIIVDSINPEANFDITSPNFITAGLLEACGSAEIQLKNLPEETPFINPNDQHILHWNLNMNSETADDNWFITYGLTPKIDTAFTKPGIYRTCLVESNFNGCTDTTCKDVFILNSVESGNENTVIAMSNYTSQTVTFQGKSPAEPSKINIYSIGGKLMKTVDLEAPIQTVNFNATKGTYVFSITTGDRCLTSGKFVFGY